MILIRCKTSVANENSTGNFLVEHDSHLRLNPNYNIKVCDIENIVPIKLLLLIDGLWIGSSLQKAEYLFLLKLTGNVSSSPSFISCNISKHTLNTSIRYVLCSVHHCSDPLSLSFNELRRICDSFGIREQHINVTDTVLHIHSTGLNSAVLKLICVCSTPCIDRLLKCSITLHTLHNSVNIIVLKHIMVVIDFRGITLLVKCVEWHIVSSFVILFEVFILIIFIKIVLLSFIRVIFFIITLITSHSDNCVNCFLLIWRKLL